MTVDGRPPDAQCPKRMVFGPCGGVRPGGACEMDANRWCPWADPREPRALTRWEPADDGVEPLKPARPLLVTDLSVPPYDTAAVHEAVGALAPYTDVILVGEHHHRPDFPPTMMATEILRAGSRPWVTLTCRDRNRVVLEQELVGLEALGVDVVLCVTGDGRGRDVRPEVTQVFDLDSTRLAHLAARTGLAAAVAIAPSAPPRGLRPAALAQKQRAGASLAVSNHVAAADELAMFLDEARAVGADLPVVASVAVYTDEHSAAVLQAFPGLGLDDEAVAEVLAADDPVTAGIDAAVAEAQTLLAVPGVVGLNLSGMASATGWRQAVEIQAEVARRVRRLAGDADLGFEPDDGSDGARIVPGVGAGTPRVAAGPWSLRVVRRRRR